MESNAPAFPHFDGTTNHPGLTMRDFFAAAALTGILACQREHAEGLERDGDRVREEYEPIILPASAAFAAYDYANAMFEAREAAIEDDILKSKKE